MPRGGYSSVDGILRQTCTLHLSLCCSQKFQYQCWPICNASLRLSVTQLLLFSSCAPLTAGQHLVWCVQNYYVYLALKQNTNTYNLQAAAKLGLDVTDDSYTSAPGDCQYANSTATANGGRKLLHGDMDTGASSPTG